MKIFDTKSNLDFNTAISQTNSSSCVAKNDLIAVLGKDWEMIISIAEKYSQNPDRAIMNYLKNWWNILDIKI